MARRTVRAKIPSSSPEKMTKLGEDIVDQNKRDGTTGPLANGDVNMAEFEKKLTTVVALRDDAEKLSKQAEKKIQEANQILGIDKGQTISTPGTIYFDIGLIKTRLLGKFKNMEDTLGLYGFNVVIGTSSSPKRKS